MEEETLVSSRMKHTDIPVISALVLEIEFRNNQTFNILAKI